MREGVVLHVMYKLLSLPAGRTPRNPLGTRDIYVLIEPIRNLDFATASLPLQLAILLSMQSGTARDFLPYPFALNVFKVHM